MSGVWRRLRDRKIAQWALAYLAGAWLVLQVLELLLQAFAWPDSVLRGATVLAGVGLAGAVTLAWYHGERGRQRVTGLEALLLAAILATAAATVVLTTRRGAGDAGSVDAVAGPSQVTAGQGSVAVLPFVDDSPGKDQEYLADGIADQIISLLTRIQGLRVPARTSAFAFKGRDVAIREIARDLGVANVVEGSVIKAGPRVRVTARLVSVQDGYLLWSDTYDRDMSDIFVVQDEITTAIVDALKLRLGTPLHSISSAHTPERAEAYETYLHARQLLYRRTRSGLLGSIDGFRAALRQDPGYAAAYSGLAAAYGLSLTLAYAPPDSIYGYAARSVAAANAAIRLDSLEADAFGARGYVGHFTGAPTASVEADFRRALDLKPGSAEIHGWYAQFLGTHDRAEEAAIAVATALELDPVAPGMRLADVATALLVEDYEKARAGAAGVRGLYPDLRLAWLMEAIALLGLDRAEECLSLERLPGLAKAMCLFSVGRTVEADRTAAAVAGDPSALYAPYATLFYSAWAHRPNAVLAEAERSAVRSPIGLGHGIEKLFYAPLAEEANGRRLASELDRMLRNAWRRVEAESRSVVMP